MVNNEDQQWMIQTVKDMDKDKSGTIDLQEFVQLLRKVWIRRETETNARENRLIEQSSIPPREAEEWVKLFRSCDQDHQNALTLIQLRHLFDSIGIKWGIESNDLLLIWMKEMDENSNNVLDFGEFLCLLQKMIVEDFHGIRSKTMGRDGWQAAQDKVRWLSDAHIKLAWNQQDEEPLSPTLAPRASVDFSAGTVLAEIVASAQNSARSNNQEPISPTSQAAVSKLSDMLAAQSLNTQ
jgi:Ca2+-binding EF-hand superfamily protein